MRKNKDAGVRRLDRNMEELIFTKEELTRLEKYVDKKGHKCIQVDLHGCTADQTRKFLKNLINCQRDNVNLKIIHGYKHGTVLRDIIRSEQLSKRTYNLKPAWRNEGVTYLRVCRLA